MEKIKTLKLNLLNFGKINWPSLNKPTKFMVVSVCSLLVFLFLSGILFVGYEKAYADKIFPGVSIQGVDVGGKTRVQANALLESQVVRLKDQNITIIIGDVAKEVKPTDLGVDFKISEVVDQAYSIARVGDFWQKIPSGIKVLFKNETFDLAINYDQDKLISKLNEIAGNINKDAKNSTVKVTDDQVTIVPEEWGQKIDLERFKIDLENHLLGRSNSAITIFTQLIEPDIKSNQIVLIKDQVSQIVFPNIVLKNSEENKEFLADPEQITQWVQLRANNLNPPILELNEDKIKEFISSIAKRTDQKMVNKKIKEKDSSTISEGQDGKTLDQTQALDDIREILIDRKIGKNTTNTIELIIVTIPKGEDKVAVWEANEAGGGTPGLSEGKYVEINLSEQRLYVFNGSIAEGSFVVSTGKWSMPTPEGVRYIGDKNPRAWSSKYKLYMPWWNDIGGGYGIHELPEWPNGYKEGEAHLGTPVSHGCIRLGVGAAEFVYNWAPIGTPVFIHK